MNYPERQVLGWSQRLTFAASGIFLAAYGYSHVLRGRLIYSNSLGLEFPATFVITLGGLLVLASVFPWGRIHFLWEQGRSKHKHRPE